MEPRRIVPVLLLAILCTMFSACSCIKNEPDNQAKDHFKVEWQTVAVPDGEDKRELLFSADDVWFSTCTAEGDYHIYCMKAGESKANLVYSSPQQMSFAVGSDGILWTLESEIAADGELDAFPATKEYFRKINADGTVADEWLAKESGSLEGYTMQVSRANVPYWVINDTVYWAPDGNFENMRQFNIGEEQRYQTLYALANGNMAAEVFNSTTGATAVYLINAETGETASELPDQEWDRKHTNIYSGSGDYDLLKQESDVLYGYTGNGEWAKIIDLSEYELGSYKTTVSRGGEYRNIRIMPDGSIRLSDGNWDICYLIPCTAKQAAKTITVAGCGLGDVSNLARQYNKSQNQFVVRVKDYMRDGENYSVAMTQLNTELMAGYVPDILCVDNFFSVRALIAQHAVEDLRPYIERDADVGTDYFVDGVLDAFTTAGGVYQIASSFKLRTMMADPAVVGDLSHLTTEKLTALQSEHPDTSLFFSEFMRERLMSHIETVCVSDFVNWEKGTCSFDSRSFIELISLASTLPTIDDVMSSWGGDEIVTSDQALQRGEILLADGDLTGMYHYARSQSLLNGRTIYPGYPTVADSGTVCSAENRFTIMHKSAQKDAAWSFLKWIICDQKDLANPAEKMTAFPVSREAFDRFVAYYQSAGAPYRLSDAQVTQLRDLIKTAHSSLDYDAEITAIIEDETSKFFKGKCSAEQAAGNIQSRVQLYVSEQG